MTSTGSSEVSQHAASTADNAAFTDGSHIPSFNSSHELKPSASDGHRGYFADPQHAMRILFSHVKSLYGIYESLSGELATIRRTWEEALSYPSHALPHAAP